jgi:hypothetical protein
LLPDLDKLYIWNMLNFAQQLFGSDTSVHTQTRSTARDARVRVSVSSRNKEFTMFDSFFEHPDLLFLDSTVQLTRLTSSLDDYLGPDIIELLTRTDPRMCSSGTSLRLSHLSSCLVLVLVLARLIRH